MIKILSFNIFESKNITEPSEEKLLLKYLGVNSDEIKDLFQDLLDENPDLLFGADIIGSRTFTVFFRFGDFRRDIFKFVKFGNLEEIKSRMSNLGFYMKDPVYASNYISILIEML